MKKGKNIQIIEWQDLDKKKFFGVGMIFSGLLRFTLYPTNLVKTRLQAQEGKIAYKGLFDAFKQIARTEGLRGFYKGFPISLVQIFGGQLYITTYEFSKQTFFNGQPLLVQHLLGGFLASSASQTIMVPIDVISQHQQVIGASHKMSTVELRTLANAKNANGRPAVKPKASTFGKAYRIYSHIINTEGVRGLYRGYAISLCTYGSNSAMYWGFYYLYSELIEELFPSRERLYREPFRIVFSGFLASATAVILTNPLDVIRTRYQLQVQNKSECASAFKTLKSLLESEGYAGLRRGLTARITSSSFNSCAIVLIYEYLKKLSVKPGYDKRPKSKENEFETNIAVPALLRADQCFERISSPVTMTSGFHNISGYDDSHNSQKSDQTISGSRRNRCFTLFIKDEEGNGKPPQYLPTTP